VNALVLATAMLALAGTAKQTVVLQCWVVEASYEEREAPHFDPGLEPIKQAVSDLTFNTYRKLKAQRAAMAVDETARLPINGRYTLFLTPVSREEDGRVRVDIRVEMKRTSRNP